MASVLLLFPAAWLLRHWVGLDEAEYYVGFAMAQAAHVINDPHFSVTYLLFYRDFRARLFDAATPLAQRMRYWLAGVAVPVALVGWAGFALATRSAQALGQVIELLFLLVGWHYAKQGFGALMVLSGRRGTRFSGRERAVVLIHCYAAWAFAWADPSRAAGEFEEKGVVYWSSAHPRWFELAAGSVLALSTLALVMCLGMKWRREGRLPFTPLLTSVSALASTPR